MSQKIGSIRALGTPDDLTEFMNIDDVEAPDEAAVYHDSSSERFHTVQYHVIYSPSYQVPVLYFHLRNHPASFHNGLDAVYEALVPKNERSELRSIGILGGISIGNHPVTELPTFFIHPCNTAAALRKIINGRLVSPLQYLQIWFGLVGPSVGLYLPFELIDGGHDPPSLP